MGRSVWCPRERAEFTSKSHDRRVGLLVAFGGAGEVPAIAITCQDEQPYAAAATRWLDSPQIGIHVCHIWIGQSQSCGGIPDPSHLFTIEPPNQGGKRVRADASFGHIPQTAIRLEHDSTCPLVRPIALRPRKNGQVHREVVRDGPEWVHPTRRRRTGSEQHRQQQQKPASKHGGKCTPCEPAPGDTLPTMYASEAWINDYLDRPADADEQADLLTHAGFPLEGREDLSGDVRQDFEMTSNRGDCTCHVGLAREIAALSNRTLFVPVGSPQANGPEVDTFASLDNEVPQHCPLYTGRVITDITVGPSPSHISERLIARGDIPRSNLVDATNFVLFELGQPTHVFDLDTLAGNKIVVRMARKGEKFLPIGEDATEIELNGTELVIADAEKPIALAGVKGGALTAVTDATKNILVEAATFDPVMVRHTSRLHNISSDSSFRFERGVSPGQVNEAAERLCQLIIDSAGGTLATGVLTGGENLPARAAVTMRTARCRDLLGINIDDGTQVEMLEGLGFEPSLSGGVITATVPWHRGDIHREVDLIEEIMRMHGFAAVPVRETLTIAPAADPPDHRAAEAMIAALVSDGFIETVTHTLISEQDAAAFLPSGCSSRQVHETRAAGEPVLRPSIIPSLLRVRRHNADQGVDDLSLFELGSTFHRAADGTDVESLELGLLMDVRIASDGIRPLRGIVDHVARALAGVDAAVTVEPCADLSWLAPAAAVSINDVCVGHIGRLNEAVAPGDGGWLAGAIRPEAFMQTDLPDREAHRLPEHPAIERDLSLIVPESITWAQLVAIADGLDMPHHEATEFVTVYRGKGIPDGQKSVSMRLRFRAADRTLTHEEVDGPIESLIAAFRAEVGAEIRG